MKRCLWPAFLVIALRAASMPGLAFFDPSASSIALALQVESDGSPPSTGAQPAPDEQVAAGRQIWARCVEACGGAARFAQVSTYRLEEKMTVKMPQGSLTMETTTLCALPDRVRMTMKAPEGEQSMGFDGKAGWVLLGDMARPMPTAMVEETRKSCARDMFRLFAAVDSPSYRVVDAGPVEFAGRQVKRLDFTTADDGPFTLFVDQETLQPAGMRYRGLSIAGPATITETYVELEETSGMLLPSQVERDEGGVRVHYDVVQWEFNLPLDSSLFVPPERP